MMHLSVTHISRLSALRRKDWQFLKIQGLSRTLSFFQGLSRTVGTLFKNQSDIIQGIHDRKKTIPNLGMSYI